MTWSSIQLKPKPIFCCFGMGAQVMDHPVYFRKANKDEKIHPYFIVSDWLIYALFHRTFTPVFEPQGERWVQFLKIKRQYNGKHTLKKTIITSFPSYNATGEKNSTRNLVIAEKTLLKVPVFVSFSGNLEIDTECNRLLYGETYMYQNKTCFLSLLHPSSF